MNRVLELTPGEVIEVHLPAPEPDAGADTTGFAGAHYGSRSPDTLPVGLPHLRLPGAHKSASVYTGYPSGRLLALPCSEGTSQEERTMNDPTPTVEVTAHAVAAIAGKLEAWAATLSEPEQQLLAWMVDRAMVAVADDTTRHIIIVGGAPAGRRIGQAIERYQSGRIGER